MDNNADNTHINRRRLVPPERSDTAGAWRPWNCVEPPRRILVIRLHAIGDVLATFPYVKSLRDAYGDPVGIDLLCMTPVVETARSLGIFDRVYGSGSRHSLKSTLVRSLLHLPAFWMRRYDVVLDLQNSRASRLVRKLLQPRAYTEFDRFSPTPAGEQIRHTIDKANLAQCHLSPGLAVTASGRLESLLEQAGWLPERTTVLLNPAGLFETRSWPLDNYLEFARLWLREVDAQTQFVMVGTDRIKEKAKYLSSGLAAPVINLVQQTTLLEAYAMVLKSDLVLSEDGGLMHVAWTTGTPLVALLGSTRDDWTRPLGDYSEYFSSSDLPCGNCMRDTCQHGDTPCLTRVSPAGVLERAKRVYYRNRGATFATATETTK